MIKLQGRLLILAGIDKPNISLHQEHFFSVALSLSLILHALLLTVPIDDLWLRIQPTVIRPPLLQVQLPEAGAGQNAKSLLTASTSMPDVGLAIVKPTPRKLFGEAYVPSAKLDAAPQPIDALNFDPQVGFSTEATGKLTDTIYISAEGNVDRIKVIDSSFPAYAEKYATDILRKAKFTPGKLEGILVPSQFTIQIILKPELENLPNHPKVLE